MRRFGRRIIWAGYASDEPCVEESGHGEENSKCNTQSTDSIVSFGVTYYVLVKKM